MFDSVDEVAAFIAEFEACRLPKSSWTHQAHLTAGLWYLQHYGAVEALSVLRLRISRHNESVGTANTDNNGYHETITRAFLQGIGAIIAVNPHQPFMALLQQVLSSPLSSSAWPLQFYSRELLFSTAARRGWVEPDLAALAAR
jgi:hypothetical protein